MPKLLSLPADSTSFYRKTRKNAVVKIVRERYIRSDIPCLSEACPRNPQCHAGMQFESCLLESTATHYMVPDITVATRFVELLEQEELTNIIVTQSVLDRLQHQDQHRLVRRFRQIIADPRKRSVFFNNKNFEETSVLRLPKEKIEDWDWRGLWAAAKWYRKHLDHKKHVVILSEKCDERHAATIGDSEDITVMNAESYLKKFWPDNSILQNLLSSLKEAILEEDQETSKESGKSSKSHDYFEYKPMPELEAGVKSGRYFQGKLRVNSNNPDQAFVSGGESFDQDILVTGKTNRNRAVHGDFVVVELLSESTWSTPSNALSYETVVDDMETALDITSAASSRKVRPTGRVVGVMTRNWRSYVATIEEKSADLGGSFHIVVPLDVVIPKIRIRYGDVKLIADQRIVVRIDSWLVGSQYPNGHYVRSLGTIHQLDTEISAILVEHSISVSQSTPTGFSYASLREMPKDELNQKWKPDPMEIMRRRDMRDATVFSIDPPGCQDIDDALSIRTLPDGNLEMGVHIADVSFFVNENSITDLEAKARGTTVYLADRRFDMLPKVLSERVCSLRCNEDRYAVSVIWKITKDGEILDTWYGRTIINSCCEMEYEQAQKLLDGDRSVIGLKQQLADKIRGPLKQLAEVLQKFRERRIKDGALELESTEVKFKFSADKGAESVSDIIPKAPLVVHKVIEEAMVLANSAVARRIWEGFRSSALLRRHPPPVKSHFLMLEKAAESKGFHIDFSSNKALAMSLSRIAELCADDSGLIYMMKTMATMAMSEAGYISSGLYELDDYYHYGLALEYYTHFTSPIRRYADVMVHRQLLASVSDDKQITTASAGRSSSLLTDGTKLGEVCHHLNEKSRESKFAQRDSTELFQSLYVLQQSKVGPIIESGVIFDVRANGFFVYLPRYGIKGPVYLQDKDGKPTLPRSLITGKSDDDTSYVPDCKIDVDPNMTFISVLSPSIPGGNITFHLFDHVRVTIHLRHSRAHRHSMYMTLVKIEQSQAGRNSPQPEHQPPRRLERKEMIQAIMRGEEAAKVKGGTQTHKEDEDETVLQEDALTGTEPVKKEKARARRRRLQHESGGVYKILEQFRALSVIEVEAPAQQIE